MEVLSPVPAIAGFFGVLIMTFFLRRARFFHLPETQMVRAIGAMITKDYDSALMPGTIIHFTMGVIFAYGYAIFMSTAPELPANIAVPIVVCTMMGFVHGLIVTLALVISVSQYHPVERFRKLQASDMAAHVIAHVAYGTTVGFGLTLLPRWIG